MQEAYTLIALIFILIFGCAFFLCWKWINMRSLKMIFRDFKRKLWMTVSLGAVFFSLYLSIIGFGLYYSPYWKENIFLSAYLNPAEYVYSGLWIFGIFSLTIYFVRMIVKYLYLTRGKDN